MKISLQDEYRCRRISIDDLIDAYVCFGIVEDENGQPVDAVILDMNNESERIFGKNRSELIGNKISEFIPLNGVSLWVEAYKKAVHAGKGKGFKSHAVYKGSVFDTKIFIDDEGNVNIIYHDISALHSARVRYTQAEEKYKAIVETLPDIILRFDRELRHIFTNAPVERATGIKPQDYIGKTHRDLGFPDSLCEYWESRIKKVFESGDKAREIFSFAGLTFDWFLVPEFDENHEVQAVLSVSRDITESIAREKELERSEERYRLLLDSLPDTVVVLDRDYKIIVVNDAKRKLASMTKKDIIGRRLTQESHKMAKSNVLDACRRVMEERVARTEVFEIMSPEGGPRWYECRIFPVPDGIMIIGSEITERVMMEEHLRESEEKYRNLVNQSVDGITLVDDKGYLLEFNEGMERITGIKREQAIGRPAVDLFMNALAEEHRSAQKSNDMRQRVEALHKGESLEDNGKIFDGLIQRPDGTRRNVQDISYKFKIKDKTYTCCITRDVTELKKLEELKKTVWENEKRLGEALELEKLRTEFFANISHELRTPLNIIFSSIQLIDKIVSGKTIETGDADTIAKFIRSSKQNCYRLLRLINNLIDVTKIDAGFYQLIPVNCNIIKVVEDITMSIAEYIKDKGINLVFDTDIEERVISCDPDKIERIMLNLLSNAIKFSNKGGSIFVNIQNRKEYIAVSVRDTGIGIPEDKIGCIFERFRQVDNSLTRMYEGSGIGLSLVKSLVEMHGGSISAKSSTGKGARFDIKLPAKQIESETKNNADSICDTQSSHVEKINIEFSDIYF